MKAVLWLVLLGFLAFVSVHHQSSQGSCKGPGIFHQPVPRHSHSPRGYQVPTRPLVYFKAQKMAETAARPCPCSNLLLPTQDLSSYVFLALFCQLLPFTLFCAGADEGFSLKEPKGSQQGILQTYCCYQAG